MKPEEYEVYMLIVPGEKMILLGNNHFNELQRLTLQHRFKILRVE